jgi:hypothetical protein
MCLRRATRERDQWFEQAKDMRAENERLRRALAPGTKEPQQEREPVQRCRYWLEIPGVDGYSDVTDRVERVLAENERLRAYLRRISEDGMDALMCRITATEALNG